jgi:TfoX/Sxy family transcriptional regulator of competence genes
MTLNIDGRLRSLLETQGRRRIRAMSRMKPGSLPKPTEEAKAAFAELVPAEPAVTLKPMFGNLSAFVNGNMFAGLFGEDLFVRLPEPEIAAVKEQGGRDFEPMAGHAMRGYVVVPSTWRTRPAPALILVKRSLALTRAMPAKAAKKKAPAKKAEKKTAPKR